MKKFPLLLTLAVLVFAGFGVAQKYGFYAGYGYDGMIGGQFYLGNNMRASFGLTPLVGLAVGGSLDFILGRVDIAAESDQGVQVYYGVGAGGGLVTAFGVGVFYAQGHAMGGIEFDIPNSDVSVFSELGLGPMMLFGEGTGLFTFAYDAKFGLLFK